MIFRGWAQCRKLNLGSKGGEVDILLHHMEYIAKLVQLGFALLVGKKCGLDPSVNDVPIC